jgi:poly(3-hydroxybutyrate) depolymerase
MKIATAVVLAAVASLTPAADAQTLEQARVRQGFGDWNNFHFVVPASCRDSECPVVYSWHGYGGSGRAFANTFDWRDVADRGWIGIWPTGSGIGAFNGGGCCSPITNRNDDVQFARDALSYLQEEENVQVNLDFVFSTGWSNGGFMSHRLACEASDLFTAIAPYAGYKSYGSSFTSCDQVRPVDVNHYHGTDDRLISYTNFNFPGSEQTNFKENFEFSSQLNGCSGTAEVETVRDGVTCEVYNNCDAKVRFCTLENQTHQIPNWLWSEILTQFDAKVGQEFQGIVGTNETAHETLEAELPFVFL